VGNNLSSLRRSQMPSVSRIKTSYPGVYYIMGTSVATGKPERIYYIRYRKNGKMVEEKAGRQSQDDMTAARAAGIRAQRINGNQLPNRQQRELLRAAKEAEIQKWTIARLWEEYKAQKSDSKGLRVDGNRYSNHIESCFGPREPKDLIQLDVDRLRIKLLKTKKPQTVKHVLGLLQRIINFGTKRQLCSGPGFKIQTPRVHNIKTEDLTPEQLSQLLKAIDESENTQAANLMKLALFTGMRRGELFKLKWEDIDFHRGFISIRDPKGGPSQKIPLNDGARQILENHPRSDTCFVFPGRGGNQRTDINKQVNRIKEKAGVSKDFRALHGLRHVYASMLASSGQVDMYTLQKLLTHKSPIMTQRYAHLRDEALRRASNLAGDIISQAINGEDKGKVEILEEHNS
jgi:integrase